LFGRRCGDRGGPEASANRRPSWRCSLLLNLFAAFLPPPAVASFSGSDAALLCSSSGAADDDGTPPAPAPHHHCQDCLAQQIGGCANLPEPASVLLRLPATAPLFVALDQSAPPAKPSAKAQPRAPPVIG
jgi:hypothetical protein